MQDALRFWVERGADGYRVDAIDRLLKDPELRDDPPATEAFGLPLSEAEAKLALTNSRNAPDTPEALARIREAVGSHVLVGEVYLPSARWQPYLEHLDAAFAFELLHSEWDAARLRAAIEATTRRPGAAWVLSNHDFGRLVTRFGPENARSAALLLLTLPGPAFLYQGDEIGLGRRPRRASACTTAPGATASATRCSGTARPPAASRPARPGCRRWTRSGRTSRRSATTRDRCSRSYATCSRPRRLLGDGIELLDAAAGVVAYRRGEHAIAVNTTLEERPAPASGDVVLETRPGALDAGTLAPSSAVDNDGIWGVGKGVEPTKWPRSSWIT